MSVLADHRIALDLVRLERDVHLRRMAARHRVLLGPRPDRLGLGLAGLIGRRVRGRRA